MGKVKIQNNLIFSLDATTVDATTNVAICSFDAKVRENSLVLDPILFLYILRNI